MSKPKNPDFTVAQVQDIIKYDPVSGLFTWKKDGRKRKAGDQAGRVRTNGHGGEYIGLSILGHQLYAHRLAYFYMTGKWPSFLIDHKDRDGLNNRWENIRPATYSQNMFNKKGNGNRRSKYRGVVKQSLADTYTARIQINHKPVYLGTYKTQEEAHEAYKDAARRFHGEFECAD